MQEFARYVESIGDKHIIVDVQNFTKEGGQLRLILDVKSYDHPELTRRWEVVADKLTGLHLDFQLAYFEPLHLHLYTSSSILLFIDIIRIAF